MILKNNILNTFGKEGKNKAKKQLFLHPHGRGGGERGGKMSDFMVWS